MEEQFLIDKSVFPDEKLIFSIIGETELLWKQTFSYLFDHSKDISVSWQYSDCGKYWVCIARKKKNTLFRLRIYRKKSFSMAFPFGDKCEPLILESLLPERIKNDYLNSQKYNSTRYITIAVENSDDLENIKRLIDLKINN